MLEAEATVGAVGAGALFCATALHDAKQSAIKRHSGPDKIRFMKCASEGKQECEAPQITTRNYCFRSAFGQGETASGSGFDESNPCG